MLASMRRTLRSLLPRNFRLPSFLRPIADRDSQRAGWYHRTTRELLAGFPIGREDTYADIGCGDGVACRFAAWCGAEVIGVDILADKIDWLRTELRRCRARAFQAIVSDGHSLPLPDACATKIACQEVLEHVDDPVRMMKESG